MILLTGGMGFIGLNTALRFLEVGESVVVTQHRARREPPELQAELGKRAFVETLDVTDTFQVIDVINRHRPRAIVHFVAPPARGLSPRDDYQLYTVGLLNVLEAARTFGVERVCLASSTSVYGSLPRGPFREDLPLPLESKNQIEAFKKGMEVHASHYASRTGLDVASIRVGSIYGPLYYSMFNVPSRLAVAVVSGNPVDFSDRPNGVILDEDEQDWCYVKDLARGIQLVTMSSSLRHRTYNIGSGRAVSNGELVDLARRYVPELPVPMEHGRTPGTPANPVMDLTRVSEDVGYQPEFDVERGMAGYIAWLRQGKAIA